MKTVKLFCAAALLAVCTACGSPEVFAPPAPSMPLEPVPSSALPELNPGCYLGPLEGLQLTGESTAVDFTRWSAEELGGSEVTEKVLAGSRLTLVSVWSSGCGSCIRDLQALQEIYERYDRSEVNVIGIVASAQDEDGSERAGEREIVAQLMEMTGAGFLQLLPSDDLIAIRLKDTGIVPETFLLTSGGEVVGGTLYGPQTAEQLTDYIEETLKQMEEEDR